MFGYLNIDKESLGKEHSGVFYTFNCGMCLAVKKLFGNIERLSVGHDINTFNVLFHGIMNKKVESYQGNCILSPVKKRTLIKPDEISEKLAVYNVMLTYYKLLDNFCDERSGISRFLVRAFRPTMRKAVELDSDGIEKVIRENINHLYALEKRECDILDEVCHPFAELSRQLAVSIIGNAADEYAQNLCYSLGKWVYLIDALDDIEKDNKSNNYNPLFASFGRKDAKAFVEENYNELQFVFYTVLNKIAEAFNDLCYEKEIGYVCVLKNIFHVSLRKKTEEVFSKYINPLASQKGEHNE